MNVLGISSQCSSVRQCRRRASKILFIVSLCLCCTICLAFPSRPFVVNSKSQSPAKVRQQTESNAAASTSTGSCQAGFQCSGLGAGKCIRASQVCDGVADCSDKSDEKNCEWCNRTISNEVADRILIQIPAIKILSNFSGSYLNCFYRILNVKPNFVVAIHLRRFSVGLFNKNTKKCENSWIEINESDELDVSSLLMQRKSGLNKKSTQLSPESKNNGKFCGTLSGNFWASFYSSKNTVVLEYSNLLLVKPIPENSKIRKYLNDTFEFEVLFYEKESLNPIKFSRLRVSDPFGKITQEKTPNGRVSGQTGYDDKEEYESDDENYSDEYDTNYSSSSSSSSSPPSLNRLNYGQSEGACDRVFVDCSSSAYDACLVSSPGYPGIYLKNSVCKFHIKLLSNLTDRLIILNDYLQLDGQMCQYDAKIPGQNVITYFCDSGPRVSSECNDFLNVYDDAASTSPVLKRACGMGRLPKIVVNSKTDLILELTSSPHGLFGNHGFLFYVMSQRNYFKYFHYFNQLSNNRHEVKNEFEQASLKLIERMQIESCKWKQAQCTIGITDESIEEIYSSVKRKRSKKKRYKKKKTLVKSRLYGNEEETGSRNSEDDDGATESARSSAEKIEENGVFKVGYLYGMNQYHAVDESTDFNLKYVLKSNRFNTIALYIENFKPPDNDCEANYLSIETSNQPLTSHRYSEEDYEEYDETKKGINPTDFLDAKTTALPTRAKSSNKNQRPAGKPVSHKIPLVRLCNQNDFNNTAIRSFLIKSVSSKNDSEMMLDDMRRFKTSAIVSYHTSDVQTKANNRVNIGSMNTQFDFKISYEFLNFDWHAYQENSVCDFIYNFNIDHTLPTTGYFGNPKASIFYKTSDESLKCRYRIVGKHNTYIRLTVEHMDFDEKNCENLYYNESNGALQDSSCSRLGKKLIIRDLKKPLSSSSIESDLFVDSYDANTSSSSSSHERTYTNRMCLCKTNKYFKHVYISKYDSVELEYEIKLNSANTESSSGDQNLAKNRNFRIKYEILSRMCQRSVYSNLKSQYKGKLAYAAPNESYLYSNQPTSGLQVELISFLNQSVINQLVLSDIEKLHLENDDKIIKHYLELVKLRESLKSNLNFYCKFFLKAPRNYFIHLEFAQLSLGQPSTPYRESDKVSMKQKLRTNRNSNGSVTACDENNIKLYSNFTRWSGYSSLSKFFNDKPMPFIRFCPSAVKSSLLSSLFQNNSETSQPYVKNTVIAEFYEESIINSSFACYNSKNKICFLTSDIKHQLNPVNKITADPAVNTQQQQYQRPFGPNLIISPPIITPVINEFSNHLVVELLCNNLNKFFFEIKYFFYKIDSPQSERYGSDDSALFLSSAVREMPVIEEPAERTSVEGLTWKKILKKIEITDKQVNQEYVNSETSAESDFVGIEDDRMLNSMTCDFRCYLSHNGSVNSKQLRVCLDETLVCDGEVNCIFNDLDEINCPFKLNAKTILIVLCSLLGFSLTVLLIFYFYRKFLNELTVELDEPIKRSPSPRHPHPQIIQSHQPRILPKSTSGSLRGALGGGGGGTSSSCSSRQANDGIKYTRASRVERDDTDDPFS